MQSAIEALSTGAPVSALIEHGLPESVVDALVKGSIGTVERLGGMTPEQLDALEGIDENSINQIQQAINRFYGQEYADEAGVEYASEEADASGEPTLSLEGEPGFIADVDVVETTEPNEDASSEASATIEELSEAAANSALEGETAVEGDQKRHPAQ